MAQPVKPSAKKNINCSIAESIERFAPVVKAARDAGIAVRGAMRCTVGCPYEGDVPPERVAYLAGLMKSIGIQRVMHCHCSRCRKVTGTGHASNLFTQVENFRWTQGEGNVRRYELPTAARFTTCFCNTCGGRLPSVSRDGKTVNIPAGSLDGDPGIKPQARIYWGSRVSWSCEDAIARHEASVPQ